LISFKKYKVKKLNYLAVDEQNKTFTMVPLSGLSNVAGRYLKIKPMILIFKSKIKLSSSMELVIARDIKQRLR
jgi:hypothetical protein